MHFEIHFDREEDGRWVAEISSLPGVLVHGFSQEDAKSKVEVLALRVVADRLEKDRGSTSSVEFAIA